MIEITPDTLRRFHEKVEKRGECVVWTSTLSSHGHPVFRVYRKSSEPAQQFAYRARVGTLPPETWVRASCGTPACVEHLALVEARRFATDSLEPEFGPMPKRVPNTRWYDWVAVEQALRGKPSRRLTPAETYDFYSRTRHLATAVVAGLLGTTPDAVDQQRLRLNSGAMDKFAKYVERP